MHHYTFDARPAGDSWCYAARTPIAGPEIDPVMLEKATPHPPMLLDERPFKLDTPGWIYEIKWDGYRLIADITEAGVTLRSKTGTNATGWFPELAAALKALPSRTVLDGEICVLDDVGRSDFDQLHARAKRRRWYEGAPAVAFMVFDVLVDRGKNLTLMPLLHRKRALEMILAKPPPGVLKVGYFEEGDGQVMFDKAVLGMKLEGLVAKRATSIYQPGVRSTDWVKVKRKGAVPPERFKR